MILVTLTAVSVVICFGPRRRPSNPFFLNSEVLSGLGQQFRPLFTVSDAGAPLKADDENGITSWWIITCLTLARHWKRILRKQVYLKFRQIGTHQISPRLRD